MFSSHLSRNLSQNVKGISTSMLFCPLSVLESRWLHSGGGRTIWAFCQVCPRPEGEVFWGWRETGESFWISNIETDSAQVSVQLQTAQTESVRARLLCPSSALPSAGEKQDAVAFQRSFKKSSCSGCSFQSELNAAGKLILKWHVNPVLNGYVTESRKTQWNIWTQTNIACYVL